MFFLIQALQTEKFQILTSKLNRSAPGDFAEKCILKLFDWFSGHCHATKS